MLSCNSGRGSLAEAEWRGDDALVTRARPNRVDRCTLWLSIDERRLLVVALCRLRVGCGVVWDEASGKRQRHGEDRRPPDALLATATRVRWEGKEGGEWRKGRGGTVGRRGEADAVALRPQGGERTDEQQSRVKRAANKNLRKKRQGKKEYIKTSKQNKTKEEESRGVEGTME